MIYDFFLFLSFSLFLSSRAKRSEAKDLNTSTSAFQILRRKAPLNDNKRGNSPLERGRGVLECIRFVCLTHPLPPLKRGDFGMELKYLRGTLCTLWCKICGENLCVKSQFASLGSNSRWMNSRPRSVHTKYFSVITMPCFKTCLCVRLLASPRRA